MELSSLTIGRTLYLFLRGRVIASMPLPEAEAVSLQAIQQTKTTETK